MMSRHTKPLRLAVLGCGQVTANHFPAWFKCPDVEIVAVCDPIRQRAEARATEFGVPAVYDSAEAMLASERLDIVDIASPRETHSDNVLLAMRHGVDVICEKPLCSTLAAAQALVRDVGDTVRIMVNENWRFRAYYETIREWIADGRLGRIVHYRAALVRSGLLPDDQGRIDALSRMPFLARESRYLIAESLIHELDVARSLLGELAVVASRFARTSDDTVGEDTAAILLEREDGLPVVVEGALAAAGYPARAPDRLEVMGTRCSVVLEDARLRLLGADEMDIVFDEAAVRQASFDAAFQHFVQQIRSGAAFRTSALDQLNTLRLVEDAYRLGGHLRCVRS